MTKSRFALLVLAAAGLAPGCGPYMRQETVGVLAYQAAEPCGQGPYEIVVPATGSRWGEGVEVYAYGPGAIEGTVELSAGDAAAGTALPAPARNIRPPSVWS